MIASQLLLSMNDVLKLQIRDDYSIHKLIYSLFPNLRNGEPASSGILYADKGTHKGERNIIILSKLLPEKIPYGQLESKRIPDSFLEHKCYNFEICINPVKRKKRQPEK